MTQSNFFDAIGVADMEKVHSAVIGWMLSDKCDAFDIKTRSRLLQQIFGKDDGFEEFYKIESHIEWKNIDILIVSTQKTPEGDVSKCWVIENKIKSSQHSDQLNRYVNTINCPYLLSSLKYTTYFAAPKAKQKELLKEWKINEDETKNPYWAVKDKAYCFLTLIDEKPISSGDVEWKCTQYSKLSRNLESALKALSADKKRNRKDYPFVAEYQKCINKLGEALEAFLKDHTQYPNVFTDGYLQKEEKTLKHYDGISGYISDNGLETIFQKCFLSYIISQTKDFKYFKNIEIIETHGTALANFPYKTKDNVAFGFQFQNGSFKVQIAAKYDGTKEQQEKEIKLFLKKWETIVPKNQKERENDCFKGWKKNESKEGKKAYLSLSRKGDSDWYKQNIACIIQEWNRAYVDCKNTMDKVIAKYEEVFMRK